MNAIQRAPRTHQPTLIQRCNARLQPGQKGIDALLSFQYMGAAEFEYGALPAALKQMRLYKDELAVWAIPTPYGAVYALGRREDPGPAQFVAEELRPRGERPRRKESTGFREASTPGEENLYRVDVWWALDAHPCPFFIFKEEASAVAVRRAILEG